jgi:MYXO-CTERM domain-containing protein
VNETLKKLAVFCVLTCLAVAIPCGSAQGAIEAVGEAFDANSWGQRFRVGGSSPFDKLVAKIVSPERRFKNEVFRSFSKTGWASSGEGLTESAICWGGEDSQLDCDVYFEGAKENPLMFKIATLKGSAVKEMALGCWSGSQWSFSAEPCEELDTWKPYETFCQVQSSSVPEPTTLAIWATLGGLGLIAVRRRRRVA